jgi:hypothetical protein
MVCTKRRSVEVRRTDNDYAGSTPRLVLLRPLHRKFCDCFTHDSTMFRWKAFYGSLPLIPSNIEVESEPLQSLLSSVP